MLPTEASAYILTTVCCSNKPPTPGPGPFAPSTCSAALLHAKRSPCAFTPSLAGPRFALDSLHCLAGGAEDRATQGCDPSADSAPRAKALNPRGLGTESPVTQGVTFSLTS